MTRGTTSFVVFSRKRPHAVPTHGCAVTGAPGHVYSVVDLWGVGSAAYSAASLSPFHQPGVLCTGSELLTDPLHRRSDVILTKENAKVNSLKV